MCAPKQYTVHFKITPQSSRDGFRSPLYWNIQIRGGREGGRVGGTENGWYKNSSSAGKQFGATFPSQNKLRAVPPNECGRQASPIGPWISCSENSKPKYCEWNSSGRNRRVFRKYFWSGIEFRMVVRRMNAEYVFIYFLSVYRFLLIDGGIFEDGLVELCFLCIWKLNSRLRVNIEIKYTQSLFTWRIRSRNTGKRCMVIL